MERSELLILILLFNTIVLRACQLVILYMRNPFIIYATRHPIYIIKYRFRREVKSLVFTLKLKSLEWEFQPSGSWCIHSQVVISQSRRAPAICYFLNKSIPFRTKNWLPLTSTDIPDLSVEPYWTNTLLWHDSFLNIWRQFLLNHQLFLFDIIWVLSHPVSNGLVLRMNKLLPSIVTSPL